MHFWIDKRSQQSGFGRSRVASSLSGSGGLGFGHPPRRMHSSNKTTNSNHQISSIHNAARHQHQQQHQQHQQQHAHPHHYHHQQYTVNNPSTSASTSADCSGTRNLHLNNNNNFQTCTASSRGSTAQQQQHNQYNNNAQQLNSSSSSSNTLAQTQQANNNNLQQRGPNTDTSHHHSHYFQHDMRYHHPQFGNMSVRSFQPHNSNNANQTTTANEQRTTTQTMPIVHATATQSTTTTATLNNLNGGNGQVNTATPSRNNLNIVATTQPVMQQMYLMPPQICPTLIRHTQNCTYLQQQNQDPTGRPMFNCQNCSTAGGTQLGVQSNARVNASQTSCAPNLLLNNSNAANNSDNRSGSPAIFNENNSFQHQHHHHQQQPYLHQQQQQQQQHSSHHPPRQLHALIDPAEAQLLPSHLKSGVCASLVLASIFVAAAKFYFDHQNSGLEVLIFIAFSMTFLLAACTVSLCHIPKGIVVQRPTSVHGEHATHSGAFNAAGAANVSLAATRNDHGGLNATCQQVILTNTITQEHTLAAQAGPPPYHIAILLPENGCKDEEESPPPSYDKILI